MFRPIGKFSTKGLFLGKYLTERVASTKASTSSWRTPNPALGANRTSILSELRSPQGKLHPSSRAAATVVVEDGMVEVEFRSVPPMKLVDPALECLANPPNPLPDPREEVRLDPEPGEPQEGIGRGGEVNFNNSCLGLQLCPTCMESTTFLSAIPKVEEREDKVVLLSQWVVSSADPLPAQQNRNIALVTTTTPG